MGTTLELPFTNNNNRKLRVYTWTRFDNIQILDLAYHNEQDGILPVLKAHHLQNDLQTIMENHGARCLELRARTRDGDELCIFSREGLHDDMIAEMRHLVNTQGGSK